jgi:hypothetical protein
VHRQSLLCRVLFLGHSAKRFAECQRALGKEKQPLRRRVTETAALPSVPGDTRQRSYLCRVSARQHSAKESIFAECHLGHSAKSPPGRVPMSGSLPSVLRGTRPFLTLEMKLKATARALQRWSNKRIGHVASQLELAREILHQLEIAQDIRPLIPAEKWLLQEIKRHSLLLSSNAQLLV